MWIGLASGMATVNYSAVQYSSVQFMVMQCSAVQCYVVQCSAVAVAVSCLWPVQDELHPSGHSVQVQEPLHWALALKAAVH